MQSWLSMLPIPILYLYFHFFWDKMTEMILFPFTKVFLLLHCLPSKYWSKYCVLPLQFTKYKTEKPFKLYVTFYINPYSHNLRNKTNTKFVWRSKTWGYCMVLELNMLHIHLFIKKKFEFNDFNIQFYE